MNALAVPDLLAEADEIMENAKKLVLYQTIIADLGERGIEQNAFMIAGEIVEWFSRIGQPVNPKDALPIFLGIEGEKALNQIVVRWTL